MPGRLPDGRLGPTRVVITPDGEMWAVNPGYSALDVVQAWHAEAGLAT